MCTSSGALYHAELLHRRPAIPRSFDNGHRDGQVGIASLAPHHGAPLLSKATLEAVVDHYDTVRKLNLTAQQKADLVQFLKSI